MPDPLAGAWSSYELSHGNAYTGVFTPFRTIGWTALMSEGGWPYRYFRETILGFLATRQPSAWMSNYGPFSPMPITAVLEVLPGWRAEIVAGGVLQFRLGPRPNEAWDTSGMPKPRGESIE
jgi:putative alpha-1,2-mannosidase